MAAEPQEVDYLEMVYSLAPRVAAASDGGAAGGGEGAEADDHSAAEARIATRADGGGAVMPVTLAWQGDLGSTPRPAVLRAYGAYGLCADVGFHPEDLPLLQRCAYLTPRTPSLPSRSCVLRAVCCVLGLRASEINNTEPGRRSQRELSASVLRTRNSTQRVCTGVAPLSGSRTSYMLVMTTRGSVVY